MSARGRRLVGGAILLAVALWAAHVAWLVASLEAGELPAVLAGVLVGALAADLLTGLVHWACDTWGDERTPWLGPTLIYAFREHHEKPRRMLEHDWTVVNREPGITAAAALLLLALPPMRAWLEGQAFAYAGLCAFAGYAASANQLHQWAHSDRPPRLVRLAQRLRLVLSPAHHARHHRAPHLGAYCISTGWLNPLLDASGFWRGLETGVTRWTGAVARGARPLEGRLERA